MKIVHINTDASRGGAAIAARRLCEAMCNADIDAKLLTLYGTPDKFTIISDYQRIALAKKKHWQKIKHIMNRLIMKRVAWHWLGKGYDVSDMPMIKNADIIYIHWINEFLDLNSIQALLNLGKPVIWYMHDMWPITGGCHHSFGCLGYESKCKGCPQLNLLRFLSANTLKKKKHLISKYSNLIPVAPSQWLTNCVRHSVLFKNRNVYCIPNVIDTEQFIPQDKKYARASLGLPPSNKLVLFSAMSTKDPHKGGSYLVRTLELLSDMDYEYVVVGRCDINAFPDRLKKKIHLIGFVSEIQKMISVYNAVDVLLITSMADNFPNVVIEAMSCGVPVVGFATGGIRDQIRHQWNGWIVEPRDVEGLVEGVKWVLGDADYQKLCSNARSYVEDTCSYKHVLEMHRPLFEYAR